MASRDDEDDDRDDDRPRRRRDEDDDDRPRRRRRRDEDDDEDYDPRPAAAAPARGNAAGLTLSIIGLVVGTCALLFSFIPCFGALALYPGIVATVLSLIGLFVSTQAKALPITAVAISILSVGIAYWQGERFKQAAIETERVLKEERERQEKNKLKTP
jgi:hypothetical protein